MMESDTDMTNRHGSGNAGNEERESFNGNEREDWLKIDSVRRI